MSRLVDAPFRTVSVRRFDSPVGLLYLSATSHGLRSIKWDCEDATAVSAAGVDSDPDAATEDRQRSEEVLELTHRQLGEYFDGHRREFDIPLDPVGTSFQLAAWKVLSTIPFAETISYAEQARALGDVRKARAVGGANGRNPIPIVVPCHRVIGSDGSLTGFAVGTDIKSALLDHERRVARSAARC